MVHFNFKLIQLSLQPVYLFRFQFYVVTQNDRIFGDALIFVIDVDSECHKFHINTAFLPYAFAYELLIDIPEQIQPDTLYICMDVLQYATYEENVKL